MLQIDLNDVVRPIIVDKEEGQFLGQVSSAILEDNKTVVAVYPKTYRPFSAPLMPKAAKGCSFLRAPIPFAWPFRKMTV